MAESMALPVLAVDRPVAFDPFEPGFVESPYDQYGRLRAHDPVHWSELLGGWVLTRYDDVVGLLRDPTISVNLDFAQPTPLVLEHRERQKVSGREPNSIVLRDEPDHGRLRRLLQPSFGPRAIETLRGMVQQRVDAALADLLPRGEMDVIADFAYPLPVGIFCEMFGIPEEDSPQFRQWVQGVAKTLDPVMDEDERNRCLELHDEMYRYLEGQVEEKRRRPGDDVMTALVHAEDDGDRLTRDELVAQLVTLYVAGHEPTTALVGNGLLALLRQPDQLALLREQPDLVSAAVVELLRYDGPNQFVRRIAVHEMQVGERAVEAGHVLYACVGAANRDPARWGDDADVVRVTRPDAAQHVQFGSGIHACLGAHLARLQAEIALGALISRLAEVELAGEPEWSARMVLRGLQRLPVRFSPIAS